jgi:GNAT superfamily N-acetyltransferase
MVGAMTLTVRKVAPRDREAWFRLFAGYVAFYEANVADEIADLTWHRVLAGADNMAGFVAETSGGEVIGLANLVFHRSTWSATWYCYLEDLFVDLTHRGSGAGRALIQAVYAEADRREATRTYWSTKHDNATARRLYDQIGILTPFVQYRRIDGTSD